MQNNKPDYLIVGSKKEIIQTLDKLRSVEKLNLTFTLAGY